MYRWILVADAPKIYSAEEVKGEEAEEMDENVYNSAAQNLEKEPAGQNEPAGQEEELLKARKQFSKIGLITFIGSLIIMALQLGVGALAGLINEELVDNTNSYFLLTMLPMYLIGMPILMLMLSKLPAEKIEKKKMKVGNWILSFFMCYTLMYVSNLIGQLLTTIIGAIKKTPVNNVMVTVTTGLDPVIIFIFMVLIAPVMEEILFRKLLIDRMIKYGEKTAILVSAFMFGMYHGNLNQLIYAFALGLFFAFIYVKTGRLIYSILLHMVINFMGSVVGVFILEILSMDKLLELTALTDEAEIMAVMMDILPALMFLLSYVLLVFGVVITGGILLIVKRKKFTLKPAQVVIPKGKRMKTILLNVGMILFCIVWSVVIIVQLLQ